MTVQEDELDHLNMMLTNYKQLQIVIHTELGTITLDHSTQELMQEHDEYFGENTALLETLIMKRFIKELSAMYVKQMKTLKKQYESDETNQGIGLAV